MSGSTERFNIGMDQYLQSVLTTDPGFNLNNDAENSSNRNDAYSIHSYSTTGNSKIEPMVNLTPPPGQWQVVPGYGLLYRDAHTGNVLRAPYEDYNPGPFLVNLQEIGLPPQLYMLRGPHYRSDSFLTHQQQWELDAATGGRIWGGYDNYHGFELVEHAESQAANEGALAITGEENTKLSDHGDVEVLEETKTLPNLPLSREVKKSPAREVKHTLGQSDGLIDLTSSTNTAAKQAKVKSTRIDSTDRKQKETMMLLTRFKSGRGSILSDLPGPYTRLPQGLVLTTVEVLT
jgi:hypothetical protein